jgi:hypothetical protein
VRIWAKMRIAGSGSGGLALLRSTTRVTSADVFGASRRLRLLAARLQLPRMQSRRRVTRRGPGAPAAKVIRCMRGQAVAHRDHPPPLLLLIVAPFRIAMGTSLKWVMEMPKGAVAVGRHSAARVISSGSVAEGGRLSPTGDARPAAEG